MEWCQGWKWQFYGVFEIWEKNSLYSAKERARKGPEYRG